MANFIFCFCVFRIALPFILAVSFLFRPSWLSVLYLLFLLFLPMVPVPTTESMTGITGIYLKLLLAVSTLTFTAQLVFQIVLLSLPPYGSILEKDEFLERMLRYAGLVRLDGITAVDVLTWISPEIIMFLTSIAIFVTCKKLVVENPEGANEEGIPINKTQPKKRNFGFLVTIGKYVVLASLCFAAVLRPSVQGGIYFIVFLSAATWWACYKELAKAFAIVLRIIMVLVVCHIGCLYAYQFDWTQEVVGNTSYARYFGLTGLYNATSSSSRHFEWNDYEWATYVNPVALLWLYYVLALESKFLLKPQVKIDNSDPSNVGETTPLIRGVSPSSRRYGSGSKRSGGSILQDSTGSVTVTGDTTEDIPMQQLGKEEEDYEPTLLDNILFAFETLVQVIIRSSYIGTNIIMMAWSITYLSWLTFVLLIWANLLWLVPNQRKSMLRSSPALVVYAWFLLLSAYIYSMDLTEEELPSTVKGINFAQIGFQKVTVLPCNPLLVKCLYSIMFWITLRQYMQERHEAKQTSALADMVAPLQVTVRAATGAPKEEEKGSKIMKIIGDHLKNFLTKFWIWIVAITLFTVAITGERMTAFRIIYMALFLFFVLTFQLSFRIWRKMMFGFWLTVIVYSMAILVMVYTYQFDNFPTYWQEYLHVPVEQQHDLGLEIFETKQLFVRLVTPTFFVIITVIQLHYFHKDFMELSDTKSVNVTDGGSEGSSVQEGAFDPSSEKTDISDVKIDFTDLANVSMNQLQVAYKHWLKKFLHFKNLTFLFLELHMPKIVLLMAMMVCVYDKCAMHFVIVVLIALAFTFGRSVQVFCIYSSSALVSVLLLARMVYQIQYIEHDRWNGTCNFTSPSNKSALEVTTPLFQNISTNETKYNSAEWLGFRKSTYLPGLVKWNIIYILTVTLWSVVLVRQFNHRVSRGKPTSRPFFMFPKITRAEADKNLRNCVKYLANYGFYKFGVEISFMAIVALIGFRMDLYATIHAIWLCIMISMSRTTLSKIWNFYLAFVGISLPYQYFMSVGLPPSLCIDYPWLHSVLLRKFQEWAYLLDYQIPPAPKKLICDFVLLLMVSRQSVVFRIERRYKEREYPGGTNDVIIHHAEEKDFVNPVPDFVTYVRTYLDIFKRAFLLSFLWITLAIVFLAGTNRVNVFSIGYLIGAFIFLWHGTDLYLKPIPVILKSWNILLAYNVAVIFLKTALQIVGCVFIQELPASMCWPVQLFAIGCVRKFGNVEDFIVEQKGSEHCTVPREYIGLVWDGLCFGFLLVQRRIFHSYNFFHMIDEAKATTILASRGAELIAELRQKKMTEQDEQERRILEKIKAKMDKIKANQQKIHETGYKDTSSHFVDRIFSKSRPLYQKTQPMTYKQAIRSGDYYMFDDLEDDELEMIDSKELDEEEEKDRLKRTASKKRTVGEVDEPSRKEVVIVEESEPKPGTSKDEDFSELSEPKDISLWQKILNYILFAWAFIDSLMISLTNYLNRYSKDYRYVAKVLTKEKKILKEKTDFSVGLRLGSGKVWQPAGSYHSLLQNSRGKSLPSDVIDEYEEMSSYDQPSIFRLLLAVWYIVLSHSDILCYFIIFLNQIKSATFLSLPLPLLVFLWGSLSTPRPTKTFWVTIIAYTEIIVLIKCMFQFDIISWNKRQDLHPFYAPRIIGIERKKNYAVWDLLVLLVVFFHRFLLKALGLWKSNPIVAAKLADGEYKVEDGELKPVKNKTPESASSPINGLDSGTNAKHLPPRKGSDLQRLVEETEDVGDDEKKQVTSISSEDHSKLQESIISGEASDKIVSLRSEEVDASENLPNALQLALSKYAESIKNFFAELQDPTSRVSADVYSYMFLCDFFNFFVIILGFSAFGTQQGDGGVTSYLEENRVPVLFLLMLILQFTLIIVDRAIYLRKFIFGKIVFQFLQVFILHIWLFVIFPIITERNFNSVIPPQMYYMVKCFYLLLSAYQIRCGYPSRILGNFLCKGYTYVNMFLFKAFMIVPFLFELRTVMDWMWTDTSMTVFDWIKMEDIFAHIFQLKCSRHAENEYPQPRGERKSPMTKYMMGGAILFIIIAIIWFPLVFFSLGSAVGEPNKPYDVTLDLRIGPYEPVYHISAQANSIFQFKEYELKNLTDTYIQDKAAVTFLSNYEAADIAAVSFITDSANVWGISPPDRKRMIAEVNSSNPITVRLEYQISHKSNTKEDPGTFRNEVEITLEGIVDGKQNPERQRLFEMLQNQNGVEPISLNYILPKFLKVTNRGTVTPVSVLMKPDPVEEAKSLRTVTLKLDSDSSAGSLTEWWEIREICNDSNYDVVGRLPYSDCNSIVLYTFNDKIFPATLNFITGAGIIGLYTTLVFVASRVLRGFFAEICFKIMFDDMPNVDRVLQLCLDIYLVREAREFSLEEDLFAKLVFLFRSPETLIKWTRPKEELEDDEDPEGENDE